MTETQTIINIFTDGSGSSYTSKAPVRAGFSVFFGDSHPHNVSQSFNIGEITHNRAEIYAVLRALELIHAHHQSNGYEYVIHSDSDYTIKSINKWINDWKKKGWKTASKSPVKNIDLWKQLDTLREDLVQKGYNIKYKWVRAHLTEPANKVGPEYKIWFGNMMADTLAKAGRDMKTSK
jgi:ribonuclease HI